MNVTGFYAVLDRDDEALARALVIDGGAKILQVRIKPRGSAAAADASDIVRIARMARRICDEAGAMLVVNDRVDIAMAVRADGVHLGQTDLPIADARRIAGDRLFIGVSTHDLEQVRIACTAGADYLGFGPVFATSTKANPDAVQGIEQLRAAVALAKRVPVVAIGGVMPAHAAALYAAGASAICAIGAVNEVADVGAAARSLARS
ncbi:MAG: thiamine phosphate synthase [Myxococcota bacterium]|nr:thiamine phosphate synthase [Deltaproteobacteria bacterium]MDQ3338523.1 thiamine phosphate synthase [Myxococcota bacterium]